MRFDETRWGDGYTEGSPWHHSFPPFDVELLSRLHGSKLRDKILRDKITVRERHRRASSPRQGRAWCFPILSRFGPHRSRVSRSRRRVDGVRPPRRRLRVSVYA